MDLIRLGRNEIKRNWTRTGVALAATALAAWMLVVSHMIPRGYPWGVGQAERAFTGGDLVVLPLSSRVESRNGANLTVKPWEGRDWQSHALYYFHRLPQEGYISEGSLGWRAFDPREVMDLIKDVPGVARVEPYVSLPCLVGSVQAILRARDALDAESFPLSMARFIVEGEYPGPAAGSGMEALFPNFGGLEYNLVGSSVPVRVPRLVVNPAPSSKDPARLVGGAFGLGLDWDNGASVVLEVSGKYRVNTNQVLEPDATALPEFPAPGEEARFWDRPEVFVTKETFQEILAQTQAAVDLNQLPTYELLISVDRMSEAKAIASGIQEKLGEGFQVYPVPELKKLQVSGSALRFQGLDAGGLLQVQGFMLSGVIVAGSSYIMLVQQKRKIGLLRVIGATGKDVVVYVLTIVGYVAAAGAAIGFLAAKVLSLWSLLASEITAAEWIKLTFIDFISVFGMSLGISLALGTAVGLWAARVPSAEVLKRE